jgi:hypothetical protein
MLQKIANYFEVTTDYLLWRTESPTYNQETEDERIDKENEQAILDAETHVFFKDYLSAPEEKKAELRRFFKYIIEDDEKKWQQDTLGFRGCLVE